MPKINSLVIFTEEKEQEKLQVLWWYSLPYIYLVLGIKFASEEKLFLRNKLKFVFDRNWFNTKPHVLIGVPQNKKRRLTARESIAVPVSDGAV